MKYLSLLLLVCTGCIGTHQELNYSLGPFAQVYRPTMTLEVNGKKSAGAIVVPEAKEYKIKTTTENSIQFERLTSCHRAVEAEDIGREHDYVYTPAKGVEDNGNCGITIEGFNTDLKHEWGLVVFEDKFAQVFATLKCSGNTFFAGGTSACVALAGLKQQIVFTEEMTPLKTGRKDCIAPEDFKKNGTTFEFYVTPGICAYYFKGKSGYHRLWTMGYQRKVRMEE